MPKKIPKNWQEAKLGELITLNYGNGLPENQRIGGNIPVYGSSGITGWHNKKLIDGPSIIVGRKGTVGSLFFVEVSAYPIDTTYYILQDSEKYDLRFIYYLLKNSNIDKLNSDAAVPGLNRNFAYSQEFIIPTELPIQKKVSKILFSFDNLIEKNCRRIEILEKMAQLLYREWFVEFRFPGHEKVKMVNSELSKIPKGWKRKSIKSVLNKYTGGGWGKEEENNEFPVAAYVIRGTDIPRARKGDFSECPFRYHKESNFLNRQLFVDDIIFEVSGGSEGQPLGRSVLINQELLSNFPKPVIPASFCKLIRPNKPVSSEYLHCLLNYWYKTGELGVYQVQSTGISNYHFEAFIKNTLLVIPDIETLKHFSGLTGKIYKEIQKLGRINRILEEKRDILLPKLMLGEIEV